MTAYVEWRFANATVIGTSHVKTGTPCQDHYRCRVFRNGADEPIIAIAVSDGAGSATRGEDGAAITCASLIEQAELLLARRPQPRVDDGTGCARVVRCSAQSDS